MMTLIPYKKIGRPKKVLDSLILIPAASIGEINTHEISTDKSKCSDYDIVLDKFNPKRDTVV